MVAAKKNAMAMTGTWVEDSKKVIAVLGSGPSMAGPQQLDDAQQKETCNIADARGLHGSWS